MNSYNPLNMCSESSRDKLKTYLHYRNADGHKIYECGDKLPQAPTRKFAWPLNEVVISGHVAN